MPSAFGAILQADAIRERRHQPAPEPEPVFEELLVLDEEERPNRDEDYCDWSFLRKEQCAGPCCLNHHIDPELLEANKP